MNDDALEALVRQNPQVGLPLRHLKEINDLMTERNLAEIQAYGRVLTDEERQRMGAEDRPPLWRRLLRLE